MTPRRHPTASFILMEVMLSVVIFALGVLGIGRAVSEGLNAEVIREEDRRARVALENRMAEIEQGDPELRADRTDRLEGIFEGLTVEQKFEPAELVDEEKKKIQGIDRVTLRVSWESAGEPQQKEIWFYVRAR
jgi:hypothetical protein